MRYVRPALLALLAGWGAVGILALLVWLLPRLPEPFWPIPLIVAAAPLAWHLAEWRLTKRRVFVGALLRENGSVRAWLWRGRLIQAGAAPAAAVAVTALYLSASFFEWQHWAALAACVLMLALALGPARAALGSQVETAHLGMAVRHGPLAWLGILVLGAAFVGLGFVLDQPDLRGETFAAVLQAGYEEGAERAEAASLQWLLGAANAVRLGVWYWAQVVGSQLDSAAAWLFWLAFLLGVGGIATMMSAYVLAWTGLAERTRPAAMPGTRAFRLGFVTTLAVIGGLYAWASTTVPRLPFDPARLPDNIVAYLDPCSTSRAAAQHAVATAADDLSLAAGRERSRTQEEIETAVDSAFARLDPAVDLYLDWYFSLSGEYARVWESLFGDSAAYLAAKFEEMVLAESRPRLAEGLGDIESRSADRLQAMASRLSERLHAAVQGSRCLAAVQADLPPPAPGAGPRHVYGAATGSVAGIAAGLALGARPIATGLFGRTALKRGLSATGGAAAGAAVCSASGPGAILCGVVAGIGTWIAVDVLVLWGDEYLSRDGMRAEIMAALDETRRELIDSLAAADAARIAAAVDQIRAVEAQLFSPIHEGVGRPRQRS
ncbi:MAG TPA: hypothetical protein VHG92_02505 [Afifellaceae bacterium]|nr:hypothetical protein [Afifellaceae bacterium]